MNWEVAEIDQTIALRIILLRCANDYCNKFYDWSVVLPKILSNHGNKTDNLNYGM